MAFGDRHAEVVILSELVRERAVRTKTTLRYTDCPDLQALATAIVEALQLGRHPFLTPDDEIHPYTVIFPDGALGSGHRDASAWMNRA